MAETIVNSAITKLVQIVNTEVDLLGSLPEEVGFISDELQSIKAIMNEAEKQSEDDDGIKEWVRQMRDISYQIEDVVDDYVLFLQQKYLPLPHVPLGVLSCFCTGELLARVAQYFTQVMPKRELVKTIIKIKENIKEVNSRRERYEFITTDRVIHERRERECRWQDICSIYEEDSELVGREGHLADVIKHLEQHPLVALVGMGGLGKSTLALKVYNQEKGRFGIHAWITVSQSHYSVVNLLANVYKQFCKTAIQKDDWVELDKLEDVGSLTEKLRSCLLKTKSSYMVVLDDVWEEMPLIQSVRAALPANNEDSRILITTRDEGIATSWASRFKGHIYQLKTLPADEAWLLFCKKTFDTQDCPAGLREYAEDIVKKCDGLPLVLVATGGLLSTKMSNSSEWKKLRDTLGTEYGKNRPLESSSRTLLLSYQELPYYLKPCFLYFGMFPEDYSINRMRLVRLWIAEGFINTCRGKTLEEVALEYLNALVNRNLVQVSQRDETGRCLSFRVHDVLREIILSKLEESGFSLVMSKGNHLDDTHFRRLSIHPNTDQSIPTYSNECNIRTILVFENNVVSQLLSRLITCFQAKLFRLLRVIDLQDVFINDNLPEEVGYLQNLHFFSLRRTNVKELPKSIGNLLNLQTLDLKASNVSYIPCEAKSLTKLRHLILSYQKGLSEGLEAGVLESFRDLQNLAFIEGSVSELVLEMRNLKQLTRLKIVMLTTENGDNLCSAIQEMEHLRSLTVASAGDQVLNLENLTEPPRLLERLKLIGKLRKLPDWIPKCDNLVSLKLVDSRLDNDPVEEIQGLANLVHLMLVNAYEGVVLDFGINGFQKLQHLNLYGLYDLLTLEGDLPALRELKCEHQLRVPPYLEPYTTRSAEPGPECNDSDEWVPNPRFNPNNTQRSFG